MRRCNEERRELLSSCFSTELATSTWNGHLTQGDRSLGTAEVNFEVLYKGRFSDMWPFAAKP